MPESFQMGPVTFEVSAAVTAGQVVMADASNVGKVKPATANAATVIGVARDDAAPAGSGSATNFATLRPEVAVIIGGVTKVKFAADCDLGEKVVAAATGQVTPVTAAGGTYASADAEATRNIVGVCVEANGVTSGSFGRIMLVR